MELTSSAFANNGSIPPRYTCDGAGSSPPLGISGVPAGAQSLALVIDDPDVPKALKADGVFDHWVLYDLPAGGQASRLYIAAGSVPEGAVMGLNGAGKASYYPPCPPKQYEPSEHRYIFTLYALDEANLSFANPPTKDALLQRIEGHIIAQTQLVGRYKRP